MNNYECHWLRVTQVPPWTVVDGVLKTAFAFEIVRLPESWG